GASRSLEKARLSVSPAFSWQIAMPICYTTRPATRCTGTSCRSDAIVNRMNVKLLDLQAQYLPIRNEIRRAIDEVCDEQALILGPHVEKFEKNLAAYCQTKHAIGVSSGTDALLCSLMALGVGPGGEVICPTFTFFAK